MPTHTAWIDPELLLEHQGVQVYCTYKEDDYDQGAKRYWFTVNAQCGELDQLCDDQPCRHVFDVRELSTWQPPAQPPFCTGANDTPENRAAWDRFWEQEEQSIQAAIRKAIERGELTARGWLGASPAPTGESIPGKGLE